MFKKPSCCTYLNKKIVLASSSPQRISLLKQWGFSFESVPSEIDEQTSFVKPSFMVKDIAYKKGFCVACMYPDALILAADTIVVLNGKVFGKPKNKQESETMIRLLNGSRHSVYTGVAIIQGDKKSVFYDVVHIKMKKIPEYELKQLFGKHTDKAGSYAIQDHDDNFVDKIYGDRYTAVGLPYTKLVKELERFWN